MLRILREALASWDATESDLADAASIFMVPPPEAFHSSCTATQAVVDALIRIVGAERPQSALTSPPLAEKSAGTSVMTSSTTAARAAMLELVAEFVTAGRATVQLRDALPILECLADPAKVQSLVASYHMRQSNCCHRPAAYPVLLGRAHHLKASLVSWAQLILKPINMQHVARQLHDRLPDVLQGSGAQEGDAHSQEQSFAAVLLSAVGGRPESDAEAGGVLRRALQLARGAGYLQAQAQVCIHS